MEVLGCFAAGIAHDFNNLVTAMLGYAELVAEQIEANSPVRQDIEELQRAAQGAESLTRQLLMFSRKGTPQLVVLDLNEVVRRLERLLRRIVGEQIELVVRLALDVGHIRSDVNQVEQVMMNLVLNARDAMPDGGTLTIETSCVRDSVGAFARLTIGDTGSGMSPEVQAQIFRPFFTTKGATRGTGLGLSTVHATVQQASGYIVVDSTPGDGSTFAVYFPRVKDESDVIDEVADAPVRGSETVLFVEDDDSIRGLGVRALQRYGYTVLAARHAAEAIQIASGHDSPIDLLLTDVVLPGLDGPALAECLQDVRADVRVLYTSGYTDAVDAVHAVQASNADIVQKPYTPDALARMVRSVLDRA